MRELSIYNCESQTGCIQFCVIIGIRNYKTKEEGNKIKEKKSSERYEISPPDTYFIVKRSRCNENLVFDR